MTAALVGGDLVSYTLLPPYLRGNKPLYPLEVNVLVPTGTWTTTPRPSQYRLSRRHVLHQRYEPLDPSEHYQLCEVCLGYRILSEIAPRPSPGGALSCRYTSCDWFVCHSILMAVQRSCECTNREREREREKERLRSMLILEYVVFWSIKPSSYFTGDTLRLCYLAQPVNAM
jgi:hypothetical protein